MQVTRAVSLISIVTALLAGCGGGGDSAPAAVNIAPVSNAGPVQSVGTSAVVTLNGSASSDANGDPLTYAWTLASRPAGSTALLTGATSAAPTFTADVAGTYVASLVVNDGTVSSAASTVTITATVANAAPVANAGTAQNVLVGGVVTLNGSASSDANGDPLTYAWTLTSRPAGSTATLTGATSAAPTFTPDVAGTYVATLVVNDGRVNSGAATVTVTATSPATNSAPVANAGAAQNIVVGAAVTLNGSGSSDANGDRLTYSWSLTSRPAGSTAALVGATTVAPTFGADAAGTYVASLVVNDGTVNSTAATVTVTASVANAAPVANAGAAQSVVVGSFVTLNGGGSSDANGDRLTYSWSGVSRPTGSGATLVGATTVAPTFTADLPGTYVIGLVVNDGRVNSTPSTVTVTATSTALFCPAGNGSGTDGVRLYTPNNLFTYQLSTTVANAPDVVTAGWGAAYVGVNGSYTGSLRASLWAVSSSYSGGTIYGTVLGEFPPNFTGPGARSSTQIWAGGYSINTIVSSTINYNPSGGNYCLVMVLAEYRPGQCFPNPNGYCSVDWLQFSGAVTFR